MTFLLQQVNGSVGAGVGSFAVILSNTPQNGSFEVCTLGGNGGINTSVSQAGATWTKLIQRSTTSARAEIWLGTGISNASSRINIGLNAGTIGAIVAEYVGMNGSSDQTSSNAGSGTSIDSGTTAPRKGRYELVVASLYNNGSTAFVSITNGFNIQNVQNRTTLCGLGYADKIVTLPGPSNTGATVANQAWAGVIVTFNSAQPLITNIPGAGATNFF